MANPAYNVYLGKEQSKPDTWVSGNEADGTKVDGWLKFTCPSLDDAILSRNKIIHNASHISYTIVTGKITQSIKLNKVIIVNTGSTVNSEHYNAVKEFVLRHMATGAAANYAYPLYLYIFGPSYNATYVKWMDNLEAMQEYCRVRIKSFVFHLDNSGVYTGTIGLEEAWT